MTQMSTETMNHSQSIPSKYNHGGHELFDVHELLSCTINLLDQYMMLRQNVSCQELKGMIDRHYRFVSDCYNITVEALSTGQKPSHPTQTYMMQQENEVVFGMQSSQPKKPCQSISEINSEKISSQMLGLMKSAATTYAKVATEVTNPILRRMIADSVPNYIEMAYEIFLYQNKNQYYQVPQFDQQTTQQMVSGFAPSQGQVKFSTNPSGTH
ncbi:spore coat protein CotF [Oikeobacillus pervagus]|uniref:Spore coat protein CotF n=1 Tax=Oikeobacillus pervagus TaxID=1325931 RepID=A0AAJ1T1D9_9BACI|nr:spore coat protein [Oikeobacillus pervagus]MDQ0214871.1 spore coat protein CotF [Oikeobacillus pervagus]